MDKPIRGFSALGRLPLRVRPVPFEPAYGLLGRVAVRHGHTSTSEFISEMAIGIPNFVHEIENGRRLVELALLSGVPETRIRASTLCVDENGAMFIGSKLISARVSNRICCGAGRVCPGCLRVDLKERAGPMACRPHRRTWWGLTAVTSCPLHGLLLIDACPACGVQLARRQASPRFCRCGCDLADQGSVSLEPSDLVADRYLVGRLGGVDRVGHPLLDRMPFQTAALAMLRIGRVTLAGARGMSKKGDNVEPAMQARMASLGFRTSESSR
ncbi:TniQ family protein [Azospirillum argentinense]